MLNTEPAKRLLCVLRVSTKGIQYLQILDSTGNVGLHYR
jgi:hypothetical protein